MTDTETPTVHRDTRQTYNGGLFVTHCACGHSTTGADPDAADFAMADHVDLANDGLPLAVIRATSYIKPEDLAREPESAIQDAITDLLHLAALHGLDPEEVAARAEFIYDDETADENWPDRDTRHASTDPAAPVVGECGHCGRGITWHEDHEGLCPECRAANDATQDHGIVDANGARA